MRYRRPFADHRCNRMADDRKKKKEKKNGSLKTARRFVEEFLLNARHRPLLFSSQFNETTPRSFLRRGLAITLKREFYSARTRACTIRVVELRGSRELNRKAVVSRQCRVKDNRIKLESELKFQYLWIIPGTLLSRRCFYRDVPGTMVPWNETRLRGQGECTVRFGQPLQAVEASKGVLNVAEERGRRWCNCTDAGTNRQEGSSRRRQQGWFRFEG